MGKNNRRYVLGSDLGTSGCKSIVLDASGHICGWALADYPTTRLHPGWAEQHPQDWLNAFCKTTQEAILQAAISPEDIDTVCIVGITHNAVLLDQEDAVLRPSIIYTDTRSQEQVASLIKTWGKRVFERTFNEISPIWTWPQLLWIRENEPHIWSRIHRILFPKDYVRNMIAPSFVSDTIDPVGTLLYDPIQNRWIDDFIREIKLPPGAFPQTLSPFQTAGKVSASGAKLTGLCAGTPVITGTTDTAAEVFGVGAIRPGQAFIKLATMGRIAAVSEHPIQHPQILNYPHVIKGLWYPGTSTKFGASAFTWSRRAFWTEEGTSADYTTMDKAASTVEPGSGGLIFHPYLAGEFAPTWDAKLRASFLGVGLEHTRLHFTRAVMEGVGYAIRDALEDVISVGLSVNEIRLIGGGAASQLWAQIICNVLQRDVVVPEGTDAAFGAALIGAIAAGHIENELEVIDDLIQVHESFHPDPQMIEIYERLFNIYKNAAMATREISHLLHEFQADQSKSVTREESS